MKIFLTTYSFVFYICFKYIKLTSPKNIKETDIPRMGFNYLLFCQTNNIITMFLVLNPYRNLRMNYYSVLLGLVIIIVLLALINKYLFLKEKKYQYIESEFDNRYGLSKKAIILIALFYSIISLALMIISGIYLY